MPTDTVLLAKDLEIIQKWYNKGEKRSIEREIAVYFRTNTMSSSIIK